MNFGKLKDQWKRITASFSGARFKRPFRPGFNFRKLFDPNNFRIDRAKLDSFKANWRTHLANLPSTLASLPNRLPQDFRLSRSALIYMNCAAIVTCSFFAADLVATILTPYFPDPPARRISIQRKAPRDISQYDTIISRNLFNAVTSDSGMMDGDPVKTSLPIELMGIILLKDRLKSVASVSDRGKNDVLAVKVNERISPEALVQEILEDRVIFLNKSTNRREYIDLPEEMKRLKTKQVSGVKTGGITKMSETHMAVDRSEVDKALTDLNTVLTQARCVPNMENGKSAGFRCFQIVPGSIYDKIGMQNGDVVCGINGTELTDPGQAFELFNQLKTANSIELCIKRNRQTMNIQYDIQ
jgi:general secretion pathway protein C